MHRNCFAIPAAALLLLGASAARAVIAPNLIGGSPTATTGGFLWTYQANSQTGSQVAAGDFFTIYDFQGYDPLNPDASISAPLNWVATSALITPPPGNTTPPDLGSIYNITFQYTGITQPPGPLGQFSIFSIYSQKSPTPGIYAGQDHDLSGEPLQFIATTTTPAVPEPTSLAPLTLASLAFRRRRRA